MSSGNVSAANVTELLQAWGNGNVQAMDALLPLVYNDLRRRAAAYLRRERPNHTLETTALVNEAYLKLVDQRKVVWKNRDHFFAIAAQALDISRATATREWKLAKAWLFRELTR